MTDLFSSFDDQALDGLTPRPLADRLRPTALSEVAGQEHLLAQGMPLKLMLAGGKVSSVILWGPPGCGKTTLAECLARDGEPAVFMPGEPVECPSGYGKIRRIVRRPGRKPTYEVGHGSGRVSFCDEASLTPRAPPLELRTPSELH